MAGLDPPIGDRFTRDGKAESAEVGPQRRRRPRRGFGVPYEELAEHKYGAVEISDDGYEIQLDGRE